MGSPGCVRSSACIELFSSKLRTTALSGGSRYSATTSCSFSSKRGSVLTLKVRARWGFSPAVRHTEFTKLCVVPTTLAIDRHDQCVASGGFSCVVRRMISVLSAACAFGHRPPWLPPRGRSFSIPLIPSSAYRRRQRPTLSVYVPSSAAMAVFVIPPAAISTIRDRSRSRTIALRDRDHLSRISRSLSVTSISTAFRMWLPLVAQGLSIPHEEESYSKPSRL